MAPVSVFPLWQVFQARGSYSFLVCGVIFACLAFTFYILLLFFHRMHPGLSSGRERSCFCTRGGKQSGGGRGRCSGPQHDTRAVLVQEKCKEMFTFPQLPLPSSCFARRLSALRAMRGWLMVSLLGEGHGRELGFLHPTGLRTAGQDSPGLWGP